MHCVETDRNIVVTTFPVDTNTVTLKAKLKVTFDDYILLRETAPLDNPHFLLGLNFS